MTVSAVSSLKYSTNYNYDTTTQYKYFSMAVSDERLQQLMQRYGIIQTGDTKNDLDALYKVMYPNAVSVASAAAKANQAPQQIPPTAETTGAIATTEVPWANLMAQVGLIPTGSFETDVVAFVNKLNQMQLSASTPEQKANIGLLEAEAAIVFIPPSEPTKVASASSAIQAQPQVPARATGADIQAQLNKLYFVF